MIFAFIIFILGLVCASEFDPKLHKNWNGLPHDICGQASHSRIIGGEETPMNAYPWIARIGYATPKSRIISFRCGGVIANSKTVLTAAHCVKIPSQHLEVRVIRFGEHNTETNPDCDGDFCADPVIDIAPSEILLPKIYDFKAFKHDIALIRLQKEIKFSDFVKPICFGSSEFIKKDFVGSVVEVAGWGIYDIEKSKPSDKLLFVKLSVVENKECVKHYNDFTDIGPTQMCAGGEVGKDSCGGDSGGPLMKIDDGAKGPRYYLLGIVSFGAKRCGKSIAPGVYTNMASYMEWFLNNLVETTNDSIKIL